jgi:CBS domain-containing protein
MWSSTLFISQIVGRPVSGDAGGRLGTLRDVVVGLEESGHPLIRGLVVRAEKRDRFVSMREVTALGVDGAQLQRTTLPDGAFERRAGEVLLEHDIVDRQLVDVHGVRVVRVNDAEIQPVGGAWRLMGIDISAKGILRRLGPRRLVGGLEAEIVDWAVVEPLATQVPEVRLNIPHDQLAKLHPADIARIVDSLAYPQGAELMQALDDETAADTLEEIEVGRQADILEALPPERAADILDEMSPDAAADVLDDMPRTQADDLIARMEADESADVKLLLSYSEHSAGGMMTTDFVIALQHETTRQAIEYIRGQLDEPDLVYYVYVVDDPDNQRLMGVVSLRDLLLAEPDQPLRAYMRRDVRAVRPEVNAVEVARVMTEYNLLALPVTDAVGRMLGLVTADDALEILLPESLKRHVPRLFS